MATLVLDPVTRLEGHLKIEVVLDANNTVTSAKSSGQMFRNFENLLIGRVPKDAAFLTQRICGICPISHAIASAKAVEKVLNFNPNLQAVLLRSLVQGANYLSNHVLHFYHLALTDYVQGPQMSPWTAGYDSDLRFSASETAAFNTNYLTALAIRRKAQEMGAIIGGKLPHAANIVPGGITALPSSSQISEFRTYLSEILNFITGTYQSDVNKLAAKYSDYSSIGKGFGNLISYGVFDTNTSGAKLFAAGTVTAGSTGSFSEANIKEYVGSAWYSSASGQAPASGTTTVNYGKSGAYSYIKAPRYNGLAYEAGPIARMWVSGDYRTGISVMDRHKARCAEAIKIGKSMQTWLNQIVAGASAYTNVSTPASGNGVGLTEAPRGALGHWISVSGSKITRYQIITPTCWNASPKDDSGKAGPIEQALVGVKLANPAKPVELLRIIHSFDPCTACAVHVISPTGAQMSQFIEVPAEVCN